VEVYDLDVWWQLAIGREIVTTTTIPTVDHWTLLGAGRAYQDSHWLFQVLLWLTYAAGGWIGVQGIVLLFWGAALAALFRLARGGLDTAPAAIVVLVAAVACAERFLPRPEIATYAAFAWILFAFASGRAMRPAGLVPLAVVQALWSNVHGLFVLGPFVALAHLAAALLSPVGRRAALRRGLPPLLVTSLATLANPSGWRAWQYALVLAREAGQGSAELIGSLGEMTSPFAAAARRSPATWVFYALLAVGTAAALRKLARREIDAELVIAASCAGLALTGRRNIPLYAFAFVALAAGAGAQRHWPRALMRPSILWLTATALAALSAIPLSGAYYVWMEIPARFGPGVSPSFFPHSVAPQLAAGALGGGALASNTLGGFVTFHGAPHTLPLTDGRWEIYDQSELAEVLTATRRPGRWREVVERYRLGGVLLAHSSPEAAAILPEIARDPGWRLAHLDAAASLWLPVTAGGAADSSPFLAPPPMPRFEDAVLTAAYAALTEAPSLEVAALERALACERRGIWVRERLGLAEIKAGRYRAAEVTLRALLRQAPANRTALNELAFLAHRRGDPEAAERLLLRLLEAFPRDVEGQENLRRIRAARSGPAASPPQRPAR